MLLKRNKKKTDDNRRKCESPDCPSPEILYTIEEFYNVEGKNFCQFCYTKRLSEQKTEQLIEIPKTKKTKKVETNRITSKSNVWELSTQSGANISRIGPPSIYEKYIEEIKLWGEILNLLNYDLDVHKITKLSYSSQIRILQTSQGDFFLFFSTPEEKELKEEEYKLYTAVLKTNFPKFTSLELSKLTDRQKEWFITNRIIESQEGFKNQILLASKITTGTIIPIEDFPNGNDILDANSFLFELGRNYYLFNLIGCTPPKIIIVQNEESYSFYTTNKIYAKESFFEVNLALREISLILPFLLDKDKLDTFLEGAANCKKQIEEIFEQDQKTKKLMLNFFAKNHIDFDEKKHLISLNFNLKE